MHILPPDWRKWTFGFMWFEDDDDVNSQWALYIDIGPFTISFHIPRSKQNVKESKVYSGTYWNYCSFAGHPKAVWGILMRAWQIENWQDKKLRRSCWNKSLYCSFTPNRGWDSHCAGQVIDFDSNLQYFFGVMSENDIEEYVEPTKKEVKKDCHTCGNPCSWGQEGHPLNNAPCWLAKKKELTMKKNCKDCGRFDCWYKRTNKDSDTFYGNKYWNCWEPKKEEWPKFMIGEYVEVFWQGHERIGPVVRVDAVNKALKVGELDHWFSFAEAKLYRPWKKEELIVEKPCDICKNRKALESKCFGCSRIIRTTDNFEPELPTKTKNLSWHEAYDAWNQGWEVCSDSEERWLVKFAPAIQWTTHDILEKKYHLTGKRRS